MPRAVLSPARLAPATGAPLLALVLAVSMAAALLVAGAPAATGAEAEPARQYPFACTVQDHGLGQPIVDNQAGEGIPVHAEDAAGNPTDEVVGWSRDCEADTRYWYYYVDTGGTRRVLVAPGAEAPAALPPDVATTRLTDGREVPYLIRHERGTINRFIYSVTMLATADEVLTGSPGAPDRSLWNGRLLYQFQGGVGIGHSQGRFDERAIAGQPDRLSKGYAVIYSTATRTGDHYNLLVGGRTAVAVKDHFVATHGEPDYTVGIGGSGGGIQQYVYAQNHPGLLDAAIPQRSYPDMTTQTIHVGDCALLDRYMDLDAAADPTWSDWDNRRWLQGLNSIEGYFGSTASTLRQIQGALGQPQQTGSSECLEGWFGLSPLAMNPHYGSETNWHLLGDDVVEAIHKTHWEDAVEAYGRDPETGYARVPWDNVGVQYGLRAVADGRLTPEQFLDVNARVGSWKGPEEMVQEGFPFIGSITDLLTGQVTYDPWSRRNQQLSPDGGTTPAARRSGDLQAIAGAYESGLVFTGAAPQIPIIEARDYLEPVLDMHNSHQSFAARQRLVDGQGHHDNQVVWFLDTDAQGRSAAVEDFYTRAFDVVAQWMANLDAQPDATVAEAAPAEAVDACWDAAGGLLAAGDAVWSGILDEGPEGACTQRFELRSTSRIEAGGPISGDVYKCRTMPVRSAVAEGLYGTWTPDEAEVARLEAIHPEGVCDYALPDAGRPDVAVPTAPAGVVAGAAVRVTGAEPGALVELRRDGEAVATSRANPVGRATFGGVAAGTYTLAQTADGQRSLLSAPLTVDTPHARGN